jgi:hypothetical protein
MPTSRNQDDIAFAAYIDDNTGAFFERFDKNVSNAASNAESAFNRVDTSVAASGKEFAILAGIVGGVTGVIAQKLYQAAGAATSFLKASISLTARVDTLGVVLENMGGKAGYSKDELTKYEEELKSTGITTQSARQSMLRMIRANIDLAESSKLARIAQNAAVVAGMNSSVAFDRLVLGIQKREPELLDELGITLLRTDAYKRLADQEGVNVKALTETQQQQAILNDIYSQSEAVMGNYEAAMGSVGKKTLSTSRFVEELQLAIGRAFQPAYMVGVTELQTELEKLQLFFEENEDELEQFGEQFAELASIALTALGSIADALIALPAYIEDSSIALAEFIAYSIQGEEGLENVNANVEDMGENFKKLLSIISGTVPRIVGPLVDMSKAIGNAFAASWAALRGDMDEAIRKSDIAAEYAKRIAEYDYFAEGVKSTAEFLRLIERVPGELADAEDSVSELENSVDSLADTLKNAQKDFQSLYDDLQNELADIAVQNMRQAQEDALRLSHQLEDIERSHAERINSIVENAQESRANTIRSYNEQRLKIIQDYQRRLRDIENSYFYDADELARKRDAVGLLRLERKHRQQLEQENTNVQDKLADVKQSLDNEIALLDERTKKELQRAEEMRIKDLENLQRSLEREREIKALHRRWDEEDRIAKYRKQLEDKLNTYSSEEGITAQHLQNLATMWSGYFNNLAEMVNASLQYQAAAARAQSAYGQTSSGYVMGNLGTKYRVLGQAGQVSRMLPAPNIPFEFSRNSVPILPSSSPSKSLEERKISVDVTGSGLAPEIQRQLVAGLLEIERNR